MPEATRLIPGMSLKMFNTTKVPRLAAAAPPVPRMTLATAANNDLSIDAPKSAVTAAIIAVCNEAKTAMSAKGLRKN
jgi:hypothetical protein